MSEQLIKNLQHEQLYPHPVKQFQMIQTHVSWIILTGEFAYKIKKPVDFEFLDYSSLEKRKYFCEKELELNKKLAPDIYLEVVPITHSEAAPQIDGDGPIVEYALKMREFPQANLFTELLKNNKLTAELVDQLAIILANFHNETSSDGPEDIGTAKQIHEPTVQNFDQIRPLLNDEADIKRLNKLEQWANQQYQQWYDVFEARKENGFIKACHGDIHLGNITLLNHKPVMFDCIEFNEEFRWTDTMADLGFLMMDLHDNGLFAYANSLLNRYLEYTGDFQGLQILPYYQAYRAMVRAKIHLFDLTYSNVDDAKKALLKEKYNRYIKLAEYYAKPQQQFIIITHGLAGSGKSTLANLLVQKSGAIQIRSDIERKRLAGLEPTAKTNSAVNANLYAKNLTAETYQRLEDLTELVINAGYPCIVDATFIKKAYRHNFLHLAQTLNMPFLILSSQAPIETIKTWITERHENKLEASEARHDILQMQYETQDFLTEAEKNHEVIIDVTKTINADDLWNKVNAKFN